MGEKKAFSTILVETGGVMIATPKHWIMAHFGVILFFAWLLSGCQDNSFLQNVVYGSFGGNQQSTNSVERDVEAPDVFRTSEAGLWDGRPSLGGIWVAHPETNIPERVIIRNGSNKKFVIGALYRRETVSPGPQLVLSSEAAEELGMSAGVPANLTVIALRKRSIYENTPDQSVGKTDSASEKTEVLSSTPYPTQLASTASSVEPTRFDLKKSFIQIGIFGVEQNAKNTAEAMRQIGIVPTVKTYKRNKRTFWRVIVGPAGTADEQMTLFQKIKTVGFKDAYAVTH